MMTGNNIPATGVTAASVPPLPRKRGAFILLEGVDRCGKTTQCSLLLRHLLSLSIAAVAFRFPDRTTPIGQLINGYLASGADLDDHAVHLLFSANRWESAPKLAETLASGTTVICDRYAYSGVAFSSAKVDDARKEPGGEPSPLLGVDWCKSPDVGLPAPDCVIFLDVDREEAERRGGYGGERYERRDMQERVRRKFDELQEADKAEGRVPWYVIDAGRTVDEVQEDVARVAEDAVRAALSGRPLGLMWKDGEYELPVLAVEDESEEKKSS
mmetsp:Transcript_26874/g.55007  ORF Transcript_26874/g.55007 Transcript_26874/m.55007 type:complete len:271 (-) Transcript_26874:99-911(-)